MSDPYYGRTDPDRLAVFAVNALLGVLSDQDWATVVRLNAPREGENTPELAPLSTGQRKELAAVLDLDGRLAAYEGRYTPCRSALDEVQEHLNGADRPGVSQVVIFLTDGECTPRGEEDQLDTFLSGVRSNGPTQQRFQFYLLRFDGTNPTSTLEEVAGESGGTAIEVRRANPARILYTFAQAISRSQGYEAQIVNLSDTWLPGHRGARRVRLLAVAPGAGSGPLDLRITNRSGGAVPQSGIAQGEHRYSSNGRAYRFKSVEYRPTGEPVSVEVLGAGAEWDVVALPEYRLKVAATLHHGVCGEHQAQALTGNSFSAGASLCAVVRLLNDRNQPVGLDVTSGKVEGVLEIAGAADRAPQRIAATPRTQGLAQFDLDVQLPRDGYLTLRPAVALATPGERRANVLKGPERTLRSVDRAITTKPSRIDLGDLYPGRNVTESLSVDGSFDRTAIQLRFGDPESLSECLEVRAGGRPLGERIEIVAGQPTELTVAVALDCPDDRIDPVETRLLVELPDLPGTPPLPVPISWRLDNTTRTVGALRFELEVGQVGQDQIVGGNDLPTGHYEVRLDRLQIQGKPADDALRLGFPAEHSHLTLLVDESGSPVSERTVQFGPGAQLPIRVEVAACCEAGLYRSKVRLRQTEGGQQLEVPVEIEVTADWWTCHRSRVLAALLGLVVFLLTFYILAMFRHSSFLDRGKLATSLTPLYWPSRGTGAPRPRDDRGAARAILEDQFASELTWHRRTLNWLRANPAVFGLPGKRYRETVEVFLEPSLDLTAVALLPSRDPVTELQSAAEIDPFEEERILARASGSAPAFFGVRGPKGRLRGLRPASWRGKKKEMTVEPLRPGERLVRPASSRDGDTLRVAGWKLL